MQVSHHPRYAVPLPAGHPFPMAKYTLLREILLERGILSAGDLLEPAEIGREALALVHDAGYLAKLESGTLDAREQRRLGVPWSPNLWQRARRAVQGTLDAARRALRDGLSGNLAGGTHHAFADRGEGFCVLNDVAVAIRVLQAEGAIERAVVVDLDVHQGNGTAAIFADDPSVFTFSVHGAANYPAIKQRSTLDVGLPDGTDDTGYLQVLGEHLPRVLDAFPGAPVFYLAGVDVVAGDRYGRLGVSEAGLRRRERYVIEQARGRGAPLVVTLAGGYAPSPRRTAELHAIVFEEAQEFLRGR